MVPVGPLFKGGHDPLGRWCGASRVGGVDVHRQPVVGGDGNIPPIAMAGFDQAVTGGFAVTLDGRDSFDPDGNRLTYVWRQVSGPDVTDGQKKFDGSRIL